MIILLTGDNSYDIDQELTKLVTGFDGEAERLDTDKLEAKSLGDIFEGMSLFSTTRMVVLKRLSENASTWEAMANWAEKESDTTVVLVEPKVDKRTKTYKTLAKHADVRTFTAFGERDAGLAEKWLCDEASRRKIVIERAAAREIVRRRGVEQYQLLSTLEQLSLMGDITTVAVERHIEATPQEDVFKLLTAALQGNSSQLHEMIATLRLTNDPYMTMGLLASQVFALSGLVLSNKSQADVASATGVSPYVLRNLSSIASALSQERLQRLVVALADADVGMKSKSIEPWLQVEMALRKA